MKREYIVPFSGSYTVYVTVEATDEDEAVELAGELAHVNEYVGNGGFDKLIGVDEDCVSISDGGYLDVDLSSIIEGDIVDEEE